jgi:hypothetical protein
VSDGPGKETSPRADNARPGAHAHRRTVDPAIPRQVASPQSLTPLRRTSSMLQSTGKKSTAPLTHSEVSMPRVSSQYVAAISRKDPQHFGNVANVELGPRLGFRPSRASAASTGRSYAGVSFLHAQGSTLQFAVLCVLNPAWPRSRQVPGSQPLQNLEWPETTHFGVSCTFTDKGSIIGHPVAANAMS